MPREVVALHVGQCGNQLGGKWWDLLVQEQHQATQYLGHRGAESAADALSSVFYEAEHADGLPMPGMSQNAAKRLPAFSQRPEQTGATRSVKARCVSVDMEEGVLNAMMKSPLAPLFDTCHFVSDVSGAGNNWAVGYMEYGDRFIDDVEDSVRRMVERCESIQTFLITHSLSGGTGSGLGTRCLSMLEDSFPHVFRCVTCVLPSAINDVVIAPYNTCFALREIIEHASCVIPLDNDALAAAADKASGRNFRRGDINSEDLKFNAAAPTSHTKMPFDEMNSIAAQMLSNLTCSMRFPGTLNMDVNEIATNLVPYPRLHFLLAALAPFNVSKHVHTGAKHIDSMFGACLERDHQLLQCTPRSGTFLGSAFIARGSGLDIGDVNRNVPRMRDRMKMVHWNPDGFKTALCSVPPLGHAQSVLMLSNHTGIADHFRRHRDKFMQLYRVQSHVHHYERYIERQYFDDTVALIDNVIDDYAFLHAAQAPAQRPRSLRDLLI